MVPRESLSLPVNARAWLAIVALLAASALLGIGTAAADGLSFSWGAAAAIDAAPLIGSAGGSLALVGAAAAPLAAVVPPPSYEQSVLADAPSAYFRLDDAGTVVADSSGNGHDGSLPAGASHTDTGALVGDTDRALQVDEDHAPTVPSGGLPGLGESQTVEEWVQLDPDIRDGTRRALVALNDIKLLYEGRADASSDTLLLEQPHGGVTAAATWNTDDSPSLADGNWHQVAYSFDADTGQVAIYLDGAAVANATGIDALGGNAGLPLTTAFTGNLDELAVYPTALTPRRIVAHFTAAERPDQACASAPATAYAQAVLADHADRYLPLDEPAGSRVAFDASGNCRNGSRAPGTGSIAGAVTGNTALVSNHNHGVRLDAGGLPGLGESQTVEEWVQLDPGIRDGTRRTLVELNDIKLLYEGRADASSDTLLLEQPHGGVTAAATWNTDDSPSLADGNWHHLAYSFDADTGQVAIYLDGAAVANATGIGALGGNAGTPLSSAFTGNLDELAVYPTALTPRRIAEHYIAAYAGDVSGDLAVLVVHLGDDGAGLQVSAVGKGGKLWRATAAANGEAVFPNLNRNSTVTVSIAGIDTWKYEPIDPAKITLTAASNDLDLTLKPRAIATLTGTVTLDDATRVGDAQVSVAQSTAGQGKTTYATTNDDGEYAVPDLITSQGVTTTVSAVSSKGRAQSDVDFTTAHTKDLTILQLHTYHVHAHLLTQLPGASPQEQPDDGRTQVHFSERLSTGSGASYTPSTDAVISGYAGDEVSFCANGQQAGLDYGCVKATLSVSTADPVDLTLTLHGAQQVSFVAERDDRVASVVEVTGVERGGGLETLSTRISTGPDPGGDSQTVAVPDAGTWDFTFTSDTFKAIRTGVVVAEDQVTPLGTVHLGDSGVFGASDNSVLGAQDEAAPGGMLDLTAKWHASSAASNATLHVDVPAGTSLLAKGFVVNGHVISATVASNNTVSAPLGNLAAKDSGTATLHLKLDSGASAPPAGMLPISARIAYDGGQGLVGTATTDVAGVSLDGPSQTGVSAIAVSGHAPPGSVIRVHDEDLLVGQVTTPASGYWHTTVSLPDRGQLHVHVLTATTPVDANDPDGDVHRSDELDVTYDRFIPALGDVTLSQGTRDGATVTAPAGASFPYVVIPLPLTVDAHISNADRISHASIGLNGESFPATVGTSGTLHATTEGASNGFPTGPITLKYDLGPSPVSFIDQAGSPPNSVEQARLRVPPGARDLVGDPVPDAGNTDTDMKFTSTVGGDPHQTATTSLHIDDTPSAAVGKQLAGGLYLAPEGVSVVEHPDAGEYSYTIPLIVDKGFSGSGGRRTFTIKGAIEAYDFVDKIQNAYSHTRQFQAIRALQEQAQRCGPGASDYTAQLGALYGTLGIMLTAQAQAARVSLFTGPAGIVAGAIFNYWVGSAFNDQLNDGIKKVGQAIASDPACEPQPSCTDSPSCIPPQSAQPALRPKWIYDPSGTITDGPYSSPLEDAAVTILRSDAGNPGTWAVWNAGDYAQGNPESSAGSGAYGWNVPPGWYEVAATAPGHLTAQSAPVQVLPPQTGIDLMLPDAALGSVHDVAGVGGASPSVTVHFGTWMQAGLLDGQHLTLTDATGKPVPAIVTAREPQHAPTGPDLTKTVKLVPPPGAGPSWSPTLTLRVAASVKDAADRPLAAGIKRDVTLTVPSGGGTPPSGGGTTPGHSGPPSGGGNTAPGGGGNSSGGSATSSAKVRKLLTAALSVAARRATIRQLLAHGGFSLTVLAPGAGTLKITWIYKPSGSARPKHTAGAQVLVAKVSKTFKKAGKVKLKIALTAKGKKLLEKHKRLKLKATATFARKGGKPQSKSKTLTLKHHA